MEPGLDAAIEEGCRAGRLRALANQLEKLPQADISVICVGTPGNENGSLNLGSVQKVAEQIGSYLQRNPNYQVINLRSTVLPGTAEDVVLPIIERCSGRKAPEDFGLCVNPEFLREGTSIQDFNEPPFSLIGEIDERSGSIVAKLYENLNAPVLRTSIRTAEMVKYACNAFHALKVCFGNEVGRLCKSLGIDSHEVMNILCQDTKLNISPYYLKPGFAFGGSCLPKDLRAILHEAKHRDVDLPLLGSVLPSNDLQIHEAFRMLERMGKRKIGVLGISFKAATDDLRESPVVELIEKLIGKGYELAVYDREVSVAKLVGANKKYIETAIPHISSLMKNSPKEVVEHAEVIVIGNKTSEFEYIVSQLDSDKIILDMVRLESALRKKNENYQGICW